ncbi:low molecular weight protein-tyrosine-phosphatase [Algirhabdus cladophorae]|uniref:low molecular weight protein-tyrosine-phosphatase n=1 Tax=Algirhabdus cladophorae TaxID=3377108 RepID=UPI003B846F0E
MFGPQAVLGPECAKTAFRRNACACQNYNLAHATALCWDVRITKRILFVCLGNICRSPTAEAVFTQISDGAFEVDSAGTADWHHGKPPYGPMQDAALARGIAMDHLRARPFTARDFDDFDLILGMDAQNLSDIEHLRPKGNATPVENFARFANQTEVPDPYYTRDFEGALDLIEQASKALLDQLQ